MKRTASNLSCTTNGARARKQPEARQVVTVKLTR
jgi:hypothetical protein